MTHLLLLCLALSGAIAAGPQQEEVHGGASKEAPFGWPWGTSREAIARWQQLEPLPAGEPGVLKFRTELSSLGEAVLWDCDFEFVRDRFAGVVITTRGRGNSRALLRELRRLYGPGLEEDPRGVGWLTSTTHARYDEDSEGDAYVYIYGLRLHPPPAATSPERNR